MFIFSLQKNSCCGYSIERSYGGCFIEFAEHKFFMEKNSILSFMLSELFWFGVVFETLSGETNHEQWCSKNTENVTHIKGRLLDQAMILFHCAPFQNGNFSQRKEFAPRGSKFFPF